jgi:peptidoglycan/LPS O-acetylase OafA/YrhL
MSETVPTGVPETIGYLPELDALRALAITLVFVYHADILFGAGHPAALPAALTFIRAGHTGVSLFFVLSAFLLSQPFLAATEGGRRVELRRYYVRRARRILPLYWLAVGAAVLSSADPVANLGTGIAYLFFLNSLPALADPLLPWSVVWWSLAIEVQFYVLLPLLASRTGRRLGGALLILYAAAYTDFLLGVFPNASAYQRFLLGYATLFGRAPLFLAGIAAAVLYRSWGGGLRARFAAMRWGSDVFLVALFLALGVLLSWVARLGVVTTDGGPLHAWHLLEAVLWSSVLLVVLLAPLRLKPLFTNRAAVAVGIVSYSILILHVPLLALFAQAVGQKAPLGMQVGTGGAAYLVCCLCAAVTYRVIERPFFTRHYAPLDRRSNAYHSGSDGG